MSKDPKKFDFQTKEQLIELLNLTIELVDKHFYRYCAYYDELIDMTQAKLCDIQGSEISKIDDSNMRNEIMNAIKMDNYKLKHSSYRIDYLEYKSIEDKISNVQSQLLNLLGDRTKKGGVSYWRFRYEYKKLKDEKKVELPELDVLSQDMNELLNEMNSARNYMHHMTDAKFIEWINYRKKQMLEHPGVFQKWPDSVITSDRYENVDVEWLWQLVLSQIDFKKSVREILQQMKKDYSCIYGECMRIQKKWIDELDATAFMVSINGIKRHNGDLK